MEADKPEPGELPALVTVASAGKMFGVTRQRAHQLSLRPDFPKPVALTSSGARLFALDQVQAYGETRDRTAGSGNRKRRKA